MKIALITAQLGLGGAEKMIYNLALGLKQKGEKVTVIAKSGFYADRLAKEGIEVIDLPLSEKKFWWKRSIWQDLGYLLASGKYDVIHVHTIPLVFLVRILANVYRIKAYTILTMHGSPEWQLYLVRPLVYLLKVHRCAVSAPLAKLFKATHIPNAVEIPGVLAQYVLPGEAEKQGYDLLVAIVARLAWEKGIDLWLEAVKLLNHRGLNILTWIIGDGPEKDHLRRKSLELGIKAKFLGWVSEPWSLARQADLFVLPSRREGEPLALLEAMAAKIPVLATKVGGVPDLLKEGRGLVSEPSAQGLAEGVINFLALSGEEKKLMLAKAYELVEKRTWESCVEAYHSVYRGGEYGTTTNCTF